MRNSTIDIVKVVSIYMVCVVHILTFIVTKDNFSQSDLYIYSLGSLAVPLFMLMAGFFYGKTSKKTKSINDNFVLYVECTIFFIITSIITGQQYNIGYILDSIFLLGKGFAYGWFFKSLVIYKI